MVFVLTVDQIDSRHHPDRIPELDGAPWADRARLPFARTAGDEAQAVFDEARDALRCAVELALTCRWHCGIGQGPARLPAGQPDSRAGRGPAFLRARTAVEQAKADPSHLGFQGGPADADPAGPSSAEPDPDAPRPGAPDLAAAVQAQLRLILRVRARQRETTRQAYDLALTGLTQAEAAARLGITQQAVSERLDTALYRPLEEVMGHAVALAAALEAREGSEARASNPRTSGTPTDGSRP
ncbi:hypothetical protein [Rothia kristinae]|uniref:hypothetical protein n=1 Tax=Rothia kristinae TaxID=37923 RepID=UPI0024486617|nr:hypothetical protein [Rothia kristinae]WGH10177.1 hypothetical protein OU799_04560 [Rothia kristinae]